MSRQRAMTEHARLALEAHGRGDMVAYRTHASEARELAASAGLEVLRRDPAPPARHFRPDFGIQGPEHDDDDFLKQSNALFAAVRWAALPLLAWVVICLLAGFFARSRGWI